MTGEVQSLGAWRGGQLFRYWPGFASRSPDLQMERKAGSASLCCSRTDRCGPCLSVVTTMAAVTLTVIPGLVPGWEAHLPAGGEHRPLRLP